MSSLCKHRYDNEKPGHTLWLRHFEICIFHWRSEIWRIGLANGSISKPLKLTHNVCNMMLVCVHIELKEIAFYVRTTVNNTHMDILLWNCLQRPLSRRLCLIHRDRLFVPILLRSHTHTLSLTHTISREIVLIWYCSVECFMKWNLI